MRTMLEAGRECWAYRDLLFNLVARDLKTRYKNSFLGVIWSWLNPLLMMLVFTFVFKVMRGQGMANFHIFVLSGLLPWNYFSGALLGGIRSLVGNASLIKKVYFPREILPASLVLSSLVNFLIALPVLFGLAFFSGVHLTAWVLLLPLPILVETIFTLGIVLLLSTLEVFYRDVHMIMDVVTLAWFFLTPIFYDLHQLPATPIFTLFGRPVTAARLVMWLNPMASIINTYQDLIYRGYPTALDFLARTAATSVLVFLVGYGIFLKYRGRFGEEL